MEGPHQGLSGPKELLSPPHSPALVMLLLTWPCVTIWVPWHMGDVTCVGPWGRREPEGHCAFCGGPSSCLPGQTVDTPAGYYIASKESQPCSPKVPKREGDWGREQRVEPSPLTPENPFGKHWRPELSKGEPAFPVIIPPLRGRHGVW